MATIPTIVPTDAELEILQILWAKSPESVRFVNDSVNNKRPDDAVIGYTTTLKQMQLMLERGFLSRQIIDRNHLYAPAVERAATQNRVIQDLADLAFDGSAGSLVMRALGSGQTSAADLEAIKSLIQRIENGQNLEP